MKLLLGTKSTKKCPECGGDTVIEKIGMDKIRRCDNLVEISPDRPLEPCEWSEEIFNNGKVKLVSHKTKIT